MKIQIVLAALCAAAPARAQQVVTYADVRASFEAFLSGGLTALSHGVDAPVNGDGHRARAIIRAYRDPLGESVGYHYCADDWHLISIGWVNDVDPTIPGLTTLPALLADMRLVTAAILLDGEPLELTRTAIKRTPGDRPLTGMWMVFGRMMAPADLPPGQYELHGILHDPAGDPVFGPLDETITFWIDPTGSAACTSN